MFIELVKMKPDLWEWELHEGIQGEASTLIDSGTHETLQGAIGRAWHVAGEGWDMDEVTVHLHESSVSGERGGECHQ